MTSINKIIIVSNTIGKFAFTYDKEDLRYQELGEHNQLYFSNDANEGGNLWDDWEVVDFRGLDKEYLPIVELAIRELKGV